MADSLNHRQGFLLGGNIIFLSVDTLDLRRVLKLRLFPGLVVVVLITTTTMELIAGFILFLYSVYGVPFQSWTKNT